MGELTIAARTLARTDGPASLPLLHANVPRQAAEHPEREAILAECRAAIAAMAPATPEAFAMAFERLALHYPENPLAPGEQKVVFEDWRRLFRDVPAFGLQQAIDAYLMTPARFMPTPGQLAPHIETAIAYWRGMARRARQTLALIEDELKEDPWTT